MSEVEKRLRKKAAQIADRIIHEVREFPDWFVKEGGADGTFGNVCFHADYGHLMPEISEFATECGGQL